MQDSQVRDPWVGKIPWRREWPPTPVLWPGEFHGLCSPWDCKELDMTEQLSLPSKLVFLHQIRNKFYCDDLKTISSSSVYNKFQIMYIMDMIQFASQGLVVFTIKMYFRMLLFSH